MSGVSLVSMLDAPPGTSRSASVVAGAGTLGVHAAVVAFAMFLGGSVVRDMAAPVAVMKMVEVELPKVELPMEAPPEPSLPERKPEPTFSPTRQVQPAETTPAPAAAQAGQVLTASDEVVDFGDAFVAGSSDTFAGGITQATGTSRLAVRSVEARGAGVPVRKSAEPETDRSRAPRLAGAAVWDCPFPQEADDAGLDRAVVTLRVDVAADGRVITARPTTDPGYGFGREARRCALSKRWAPGLDSAGSPTSAVTVVNVRFER